MLLVTTDDWFSGGVWGLCKVVEAKEIFGFKPSGNANWYLQVGTGEDAVFVVGCEAKRMQACRNVARQFRLVFGLDKNEERRDGNAEGDGNSEAGGQPGESRDSEGDKDEA